MSEKIARLLLQEGAAVINIKNPIEFVSGILAPMYVNDRKLISIVPARGVVVAEFKKLLVNGIGRENFDSVVGVKTAGIPWASLIALEFNIPLFEEGETRILGSERTTLFIEGSVTTGGSLLNSVEKFRKNTRVTARDCLAIYSYDSSAACEGFAKNNLRLRPLTNLKTLLSIAEAEKFASHEEIAIVRDWAVTTLGCNF